MRSFLTTNGLDFYFTKKELGKNLRRKKFVNERLSKIQKWMGRAYELKMVHQEGPYTIQVLQNDTILLTLPVDTSTEIVQHLWHHFYMDTVRSKVEKILPQWEERLGVSCSKITYKKMRTLLGSCNPRSRKITLNTLLARYYPECIEYVLVHELVHILEPSHNANFYHLMTTYLPDWEKWDRILKH